MRILLIAPTFFGYRDRVAAEMAAMGHEISVSDDRPSESVLFKSAAKVSYRLIDGAISRHAASLAEKISAGHFDCIIYMGGMSFCFSREQFRTVKGASGATFTAYLWDSFSNCERFAQSMDLFDRVLSFEPSDCVAYGLEFRPLFFSGGYEGIPLEPSGGFEYDACFVGSVHQPSKFEAVLHICKELESRGLRVFRHFYMPSASAELFRKVTHSSYRDVLFSHEALDTKRVVGIYERSRAVIDSPQAGQRGLTMRTLETLGACRKLITANADIDDYDFYDPRNVFISRGGSIPSREFFEIPYYPVSREVYDRYSIGGFTRSLLEGDGDRAAFRKANA